jgi:hypothetical protein
MDTRAPNRWPERQERQAAWQRFRHDKNRAATRIAAWIEPNASDRETALPHRDP